MDNLRAMREARYEAAAARAKKAGTAPKPAKASDDAPAAKRAPSRKKAPAAVDSVEEPTEELCGHRNMSGRTCTRERGHSAKSHRYS